MEDKLLKIYKKIEEWEKKLLQKNKPYLEKWREVAKRNIEKDKEMGWPVDYGELEVVNTEIARLDAQLDAIKKIKEFFEEEENFKRKEDKE